MIELRHIQELEKRVHAALELIGSLRTENADLKSKLEGYQGRIDELERMVNEFKADQGAIEEGILRALRKLDSLEDTVTGAGESATTERPSAEAATPPEHEAETSRTAPAEAEAEADKRDPRESSSSSEDDSRDDTPDDEVEENDDDPDTGESELDIF